MISNLHSRVSQSDPKRQPLPEGLQRGAEYRSPNGKTVQICSLFQDSLRNPDILSVPIRALSTNKSPNDAAPENHRGSDAAIARSITGIWL